MIKSKRYSVLVSFMLIVLFVGQSVAIPTDAPENVPAADAPKFALLVGVNDYARNSGIRDLTGTHNDVLLMKSLLLEKGFKEDVLNAKPTAQAPCGSQMATSGIRTLCSVQATKKGILDAFDTHLIGNAKAYWKGATPDPGKGPMVFFYYSGHGAQVPDNEPIIGETKETLMIDEADGLDETLVPHDTDQNGSRDIRDDSFKTRIDELKAYTSNIVVMADSCHSGTISRGPNSRNIARKFPNLSVPGGKGKGEERDLSADNSYVTISGSMTDQLSYEDSLPDPATRKWVMNGLLTYYFVQNVREYPGATYQDIISLVRSSVTAAGRMQTPQAEGDINRPVFGVAGSAGKRAIALKCADVNGKQVCTTEVKPPAQPAGTVKKAETKPATATVPESKVYRIELEAGEVVGARVGGPVDIFAKDKTGKDLMVASGKIVDAEAFSSHAEVEFTDEAKAVFRDPKNPDLPPLAKAVLIAPNFSDKKRPIAIDLKGTGSSDTGVASMKTLVENLGKTSFYAATEAADLLQTLGSANKPWQLAVIRGSYADFKEGVNKRFVSKDVSEPPDTQQGYFISDQAGIPLYDLWFRADDSAAPGKIQAALESYAKTENVRALRNESSALNKDVKIEQVRYKAVNVAGNKCTAVEYTDEEKAQLVAGTPSIKRSEAFDVKVTNNSGKALYFYVFSIDSAGEIGLLFPAAGANELLPANGSYLTSKGDACSMLTFGAKAPTGFETIKVLVSETPIDAGALTSPGTKRSVGSDGFLETLLRQAGSGTRGPNKARDVKVVEWTGFNLDYNVIP